MTSTTRPRGRHAAPIRLTRRGERVAAWLMLFGIFGGPALAEYLAPSTTPTTTNGSHR